MVSIGGQTGLLPPHHQVAARQGRGSRLANGGDICVWRLVPPVGHCNSLCLGSGKRQHWCSSQEDPDTLASLKYKYYVLHLSKEPFHKNVSDLGVVKTARISLLYADFNVWKKSR